MLHALATIPRKKSLSFTHNSDLLTPRPVSHSAPNIMKPTTLLVALIAVPALAAPVEVPQDKSAAKRQYGSYGDYSDGTYASYGSYDGAGSGSAAPADYASYPAPAGGYSSYGSYKRWVGWAKGLFA